MQQTFAEGAPTPTNFYEASPYESMPFAQTQPSNLAAIALMFGRKPPEVTSARVLELGCASGGNIVPLAARFPQSHFTGIDLAKSHVELGRDRITALGLKNIEIRIGDLADKNVVAGDYDFIICHGVYSWAPPAAQEGILNICSQRLAPNGVAYVSYNVLPGWQLRMIVRDIFRFHAGDAANASTNPKDRIARGRWMLEQLATVSSEATPYGQLLRREAKQLSGLSDSYILGEFLSEENAPIYFYEFLRRAEAAGLEYVTDTDLHTSLFENISPDLHRLVVAMAGPDPRMAEQYYDFFQGRQFRQSLLVKAGGTRQSARSVDHRRIAHLHFTSGLRLDAAGSKGDARLLRHAGGRTITTNDPFVAQALDYLGAIAPESRNLRQIIDHLQIAGDNERNAAADRIMASMLRLIVSGLAGMSATPLVLGRAGDAKPKAWQVARHDGATGQPWTTNLRHMPVKLDEIAKALLPLVDGKTDKTTLASRLATLIRDAKVDARIGEELPAHLTASEVASRMAARVEQALHQMELLALLEPVR